MSAERRKLVFRLIVAWLIIVPFAILNGGFRDKLLVPQIGIEYALPISGIILCLFIFADAYLAVKHLGKRRAKSYIKIGAFWLLLTLIFEFSMQIASGMSLHQMLDAYDITTGNLWFFVVITTGIAPYFAARTRRLIIEYKAFRQISNHEKRQF